MVAANISSSAFFRVIQETQPTLIIDEADTFLQGYELDEFKDTFRRYIPKAEIDALAADRLPAPGHQEPNVF